MDNKKQFFSKKNIAIFTVIVLLVFAVWQTFFVQKVAVSLKWVNQAQFAGMYVAKDKGIYKQKRLDVSFKEFDFKTTPIEDLKSDTAEFALMSAEEFITHIDNGEEIVALAAIYQVSPYALVSIAGSGIERPSDFIGKTLGIKGGKVEEEIVYLLLMEKFGVSKDNVGFKELGFGKKEFEDLKDGDADIVDLYRTDQLFLFDKKGIKYNVIYPERYGINLNNDIIVATRDFVESNPKVVKAFINATINGWERTVKNPNEALDITLKYVTDESYKDREYQDYILTNSLPLIKPNTSTNIGYVDGSQMNQLYRTMKEAGFVEDNFDIRDFLINDIDKL